jgi:hypothetical protein
VWANSLTGAQGVCYVTKTNRGPAVENALDPHPGTSFKANRLEESGNLQAEQGMQGGNVDKLP